MTLREIATLAKPVRWDDDDDGTDISIYPAIVSSPGLRGEDSPLAVLA